MQILTKRGEVTSICYLLNVSRVTVIGALKYRTNSELAKKIRSLAIQRGGVKINN